MRDDIDIITLYGRTKSSIVIMITNLKFLLFGNVKFLHMILDVPFTFHVSIFPSSFSTLFQLWPLYWCDPILTLSEFLIAIIILSLS